MVKYTNQPFNPARKRGTKAKKGGSDEEPSAQVVTNQAQPVPIGSFMPMDEFARPITTLPANVGAVDNGHREFDAQSIYPGDAYLFGISTVGARYWPLPGRAPNSPRS
ncbi:meiotic activator RIM4 [Fusarium pseudocircinatum]|uniref:Meiotic activator RIM4 n=1 Tax=Fusarium pseudocircinatum TaxID=56676 RepID=A0A8H5NQI6_9HYPO|nr:meiotic activator RIM4 [Fusarium pseudocircinatum]